MERIVTATLRVSLGVDGRAKEGGGGWGNKNLTNLTLLTMVLQTALPCSTTLSTHKIYRKNYTGGDILS